MRDAGVSLEDKFTRSDGPGLPDRPAGAGAAADGADPARPRARGSRPRASSPAIAARRSAATTSSSRRRGQHLEAHDIVVPAGGQRGPRGVRGLGQPAAPALARRALRRRGRHLVRQGAGRRPLGRRAQARQRRRLVEAWRRAVPRRRRPRRQVVLDPAPVGPRLHVGADADALPVLDPRVHRDGAARHRDVALLGLLGRHEADLRHGRDHRGRRPARRGARVRDPGRFRGAAGRPQPALAGRPLVAGPPAAELQGLRRDRLRPGERRRPHGARLPAPAARRDRLGQGLRGRAARRCASSRSTPGPRRGSACASTRSACPGRSSR